jgi:Fic family protein
MPKKISYRWEPIHAYDEPPTVLAKPELRSLYEVWSEQRQILEKGEGLAKFNERLRREWAIETGLLERIYTLDRGVTQLLIERGIDASHIHRQESGQSPEKIVAIIRDHEAAMEGLFTFVRRDRDLAVGYIKELHAQLTRNQDTASAVDSQGRVVEVSLIKGAYKLQPNNPTRPDGSVHEYCPPEHVALEVERLVEMHREHVDVSPEVEAAWLHHRFTQIHPFQDGNGRVARCLATLVFLRAGWFPLVIRDTPQERERYLDALEAADHADLAPLVNVFGAAQKRAFVQALGISGQVQSLVRAEQVITATRDLLASRRQNRSKEWQRAKDTAERLRVLAATRLGEVASSLGAETGAYFDQARFFVDSEPSGGGRSHYFRWQIIETAKRLDYFANTAEHRSWVRLVLRADSQAEVLLSFHAAGAEYRGVIAVSACFFRREETEAGEREVTEVTPLSQEIFQVNYREQSDAAVGRFRTWLEDVVVKGLEIWRGGL